MKREKEIKNIVIFREIKVLIISEKSKFFLGWEGLVRWEFFYMNIEIV